MRKIFLFCFLFLASACINNDIPADILAKEKMVNILIGIHLAEARTNEKYNTTLDTTIIKYKMEEFLILEKNNVSPAQYRKSFDFYVKHPAFFDEIYSAVVDSLNLRQTLGKYK